jgi:hypothetical protein
MKGNNAAPIGTVATPTGTNATSAVTSATLTGVIKDDDSAANNGTLVNVVPSVFNTSTGDANFAYLESTLANNADITYTVGNGGPNVTVNDNDSPGGVQLYFDEDGTTEDRLIAINASLTDEYVAADNGTFLKVKYDASANSNGVAVYCDDDGGNTYERLLCVVPANADGSFTTALNTGIGPVRTAAAQTWTSGAAPAFTGTAITEASSKLEKGTGDAPAAMTLLVEAIGY